MWPAQHAPYRTSTLVDDRAWIANLLSTRHVHTRTPRMDEVHGWGAEMTGSEHTTTILVTRRHRQDGPPRGRAPEARGQDGAVGSRSGEPAFDWDDRSTWAPALDGVTAVYVSYFPDLAVPGAPEAVAAFTALAVRARRAAPGAAVRPRRGGGAARRAAVQEPPAPSGRSCVPAGSTRTSARATSLEPVARGRAGAARRRRARAVRRRRRHRRRGRGRADRGRPRAASVYEVTGPRLLTFAEAVAEIGAATGVRCATCRSR